MDIHSVIARTIDEIVTGKCAACEIGKCLITLKELRDSNGNKPDHAVTKGNAAPKRKLQKKTGSAAPRRILRKPTPHESESDSDLNQEIIDFLQNHPDSRSQEIADELGVRRAVITYHLKQIADLVDRHGSTTNCRYRLKGKNVNGSDATYQCKLCHALASSPERLASHMRTVHN